MKPFTKLLAFLLLVLLGHAAGAANVTITVGDNFYSPQLVTIRPGDIVTWQYQGGSASHPTASDNSVWTVFTINSANVNHSITFPTAGSFPYHCQFHGGPGVGMYGVITVTPALTTQPGQLAAAAFSVYPNPASGAVTLKLDRSQAQEHNSVQVFSALGRLVRTIEVRPEEAGRELTLGVADLPTGIYIYRLLVNGEVVAMQRLSLVQ